jgi:hypothetical protein
MCPTCVPLRDGVLLTWGLASSGELGHGGWTPIEVDIPRQVTSMAQVKVGLYKMPIYISLDAPASVTQTLNHEM